MKHIKILALLAVAAASMMAFAATASAEPTITAPTGTKLAVGSTLHAETHNGHAVLKPAELPAIECASTVEGKITSNGTPAEGEITKLLFTPCTNSWHVTGVAGSLGTLSVDSAGTVKSNGSLVESTRFGITCKYQTNNTDIGTLTDTYDTGATATMHIHGFIPFKEGSPFCGSGATTWKGAYKVTIPDSLYLD